jgi:hypothetical protein
MGGARRSTVLTGVIAGLGGQTVVVLVGLIWLGVEALAIWAAIDASRIPETVWTRAGRSKSAWIAGLVLFPPVVVGYLGVREELDAVRDRASQHGAHSERLPAQPLAAEEIAEKQDHDVKRRAQLERLTTKTEGDLT